ncbi:unnamed protein product [Anisakis simplex]|uniref:Cation_ATPase_C domain-containing protein n=1 Tax=Anisakis simplex TaxID=6269 RepID=A0A0M3KI25_ANISI|nr:unnamed protein product [Anisakis simplex]
MCLCNKAQIEVIGSGSVSKWKQGTAENDVINDISKWLTPSRPSSMLQPDLEQQTVQRTLQLNSIRATFRHKNIAGNPTEVALLKYVEEEAYMKLGSEGRTCLAFATAEFDGYADECFTALTPNTLLDYELCFLGMAALYDPPRETAQQSIQALRDAGVKCFMISGDHPSTATTLAKHIGLLKDDSNTKATGNGNCVLSSTTITPITTSSNSNTGAACSAPASTAAELQNVSVIHGEMLKTLTPDQWDEILAQRAVVFARTTPAQKLIIVEVSYN